MDDIETEPTTLTVERGSNTASIFHIVLRRMDRRSIGMLTSLSFPFGHHLDNARDKSSKSASAIISENKIDSEGVYGNGDVRICDCIAEKKKETRNEEREE